MKTGGSTSSLHLKLVFWSPGEVGGIPGVAVKCVDIWRNTNAKAAYWTVTDAEARKRGEQTGLDTLVVHALNVVDQASEVSTPSVPNLTD